jgi:predicted permease
MRAYNLLLHAYPASFRHEYGEEMRALFARRRRDAGGPVAAIVLWLQTVGEVIANAALVHGDLLRQDLGYTIRVLRRTPGFAITAVLIVALGIGATTAAFSVTDFVLIRPLPFPDADRLVKLWEREPTYTRMELSPANYRDWKRASTSFESIGAYHPSAMNLLGRSEPLHLEGSAVSADLLSTLGVQPLVGRLFTDADDRDGAPGTVLLSYRLWQTEFGGDANVLGQRVILDSAPYVVIGVMSREFHFPSSDIALWTTMRLGESNYEDRNDNWLESVGRLKRGVSLEQARAEMDVIAAQSALQYPKENAHAGASVFRLRDEVSQQSRLLLKALFGAAACVLLIACANLANLLLVRALGRRRELAVRAAMGAGPERLVRQLMTENLLLAFVGGALGVCVAVVTVPLLAQLVPSTLPIAESPAVDVRVLLFAAGLTALTGIGFGLAPVMRVGGRADLQGLREGSRSGGGQRERLRSALVVAEIVASVVLLVSAGLLMRALLTIQATDPGFKPEGVLTMRTAMPLPQYARVTTRDAFYTRVLSEVRALPGVSSAAYTSALPMVLRGGIWPVSIDGRLATRADNENASLRYVTPGFLAALGIPLRRGRDVSESDGRDRAYVAVVSESFVRRYWPNQDPLGRHFNFALDDRIVVGVAGDVRVRGLEQSSEPQVYLPSKQVADASLIGYIPKDLAVRTSLTPTTLLPAIRAIIHKVDPHQPISDVRTLSDIVDLETASRSVEVRVLGAFAVIAFVLAGIGIHGLLSFAVSQRAQEIGVRMALGAQSSDIFSMVLRRSMLLAAAGIVPGVALAYAAGRGMEALLAGVRPADALTMATAIGLSVVMTAVGSVIPTLRALHVDPMTALRSE